MKDLNPYTEIEKVPLFTADNMQSRGYSVRLDSPKAESGWQEVGLVSEDYLLVPNRQVRDMALEIADRSLMQWEESKVFFDGKRFLYALVAEPDICAEVKVDDIVSVGMLYENSYDGSRKLAVSLFANRLVCSNGMLMPQYFARMRFKHDNTARNWDDEVTRALGMLSEADQGLERFARGARHLSGWTLGSGDLSALRDDALSKLPVTLWGKMMDRYLLEEEHTGWGLLNAGTNILWHDGRGSVRDFSYNELITSSLIGHATKELAARPVSAN